MKSAIKILIFALLSALAMAAGSCVPSGGGDKTTVTVSIPPQKYIVEQIAGDRVEVKTLLSQGANPESYEPSMSHLMNLEKSAAYLRMGNLGFEDAILGKVRNSNPDLRIYDLSDGIVMIEGTHCSDHIGHEEEACGEEEMHSHDLDPHTWSSVANARIIAGNAVTALTEIDPDGAQYYRDNYNRFVQSLDSLDAEIKGVLAETSNKAFIVWHPSLSYFARDYGLEQITLAAENKELSAPELRARIDRARQAGDNIPLLMQRDFDSRQAEIVNKEIGADIIYINPLNSDWPEEMLHTARSIAGKQP